MNAVENKINYLYDKFKIQTKLISQLNETLNKYENLPLLKDKMNLILSNRSSTEYKINNFENMLFQQEQKINMLSAKVNMINEK